LPAADRRGPVWSDLVRGVPLAYHSFTPARIGQSTETERFTPETLRFSVVKKAHQPDHPAFFSLHGGDATEADPEALFTPASGPIAQFRQHIVRRRARARKKCSVSKQQETSQTLLSARPR
jgi:hypothetical protein